MIPELFKCNSARWECVPLLLGSSIPLRVLTLPLAISAMVNSKPSGISIRALCSLPVTAFLIGWDTNYINKLTVNTCTLDHKAALRLYQKLGVKPVRFEDKIVWIISFLSVFKKKFNLSLNFSRSDSLSSIKKLVFA